MKKNLQFGMLLLTATLLVGCGKVAENTSDPAELSTSEETTGVAETTETSVETTEYPIVIDHAFGQTVIESKPERIATIGWENGDTPLALGIAPVGLSESNYGAETERHLHVWTDNAFAELGVEPNVFDDTDGWDYEAIADSEPDVILAAYSGLTEEEYQTLSEIAPVLPYEKQPWQTTWRDQTIQNAAAMGMKAEGEKLVADMDAYIADKLTQYPEVVGKKTAFCWISPDDLSVFYVYLPTDPRAAYMQDLGMEIPQSVLDLAEDASAFSVTVSRENANLLNDVDIIVTYGNEELLATLQADELMGQIPAVRNGAVVLLDDASELAAGTTPSILSIPHNLDTYLGLLQEAAKKVQAE